MDSDNFGNLQNALIDMMKENRSLKERLASLRAEYMETLSELGRIMFERTAEENDKRKSELFRRTFLASKVTCENGFSSVTQNPNESVPGESAISNEEEKRLSGLVTSTDESEYQGSKRQSCDDLFFSVEQGEPNNRDRISQRNQPPASVATTLHNSYKLLPNLAERLLSSDAEQLKTWACQNFSVDTSQNVTDVLFQLDNKEIINASNLSVLKDFFESIVRFDLAHIIDSFLFGDYSVLHYNQGKPEVDANREPRLRQRARSDYTSPLNGASSHCATSQTEQNQKALQRSENNDEVETLIPHLPRQTPFPHSPTQRSARIKKEFPPSSVVTPTTRTKSIHKNVKFWSSRFTDTRVKSAALADGAATRKSMTRTRSKSSSTSTNPPVSQRKSTQTIGSNILKPTKLLLPDTVRRPQSRKNVKPYAGTELPQCRNCGYKQELGEDCRNCNDNQRIADNKDARFPTSPNHLDKVTFTNPQTSQPERTEVLDNKDANYNLSEEHDQPILSSIVLPNVTRAQVTREETNHQFPHGRQSTGENRNMETVDDENGENNVGSPVNNSQLAQTEGRQSTGENRSVETVDNENEENILGSHANGSQLPQTEDANYNLSEQHDQLILPSIVRTDVTRSQVTLEQTNLQFPQGRESTGENQNMETVDNENGENIVGSHANSSQLQQTAERKLLGH